MEKIVIPKIKYEIQEIKNEIKEEIHKLFTKIESHS